MKVLQIANDFHGTKVHSNLFKLLDQKGIEQIVFNPLKDYKYAGENYFNGNNTTIIYAGVVKSYHRYLYHAKERHVFQEMLKYVDVKDIDICHATTLFSDGGIAYLLYKKYRIPYVVAVRNTDINVFLKLLPHTWYEAIQILLHAKRIFFISEGLKRRFENHFIIRPILSKIKHKFVLIPNGIDDYFLDNLSQVRQMNNKIIYVGDFSNNKNVVRLCEAVLQLKQQPKFKDVTLTLVGGGKNETDTIEKLIGKYPDVFKFLGKITDKVKLLDIFRQHSVFAMPSIHETFGLVYLEALSQNLPVLYTKGQAIDGLFLDTVGVKVNPFSVTEIVGALNYLLDDRNVFSNNSVDFTQFRWNYIADKYIEHYKDCLGMCDVDHSLLKSFEVP